MLSPEIERLLAAAPESLPLDQHSLVPASDSLDLRLQSATALFPGARQPKAALAGLLLRAGRWADSHTVAQDIDSVEGSYWHGILHRLEPDSFNAGYWFRQVGRHALFPELLRRARTILDETAAPKHWRLGSSWDALLFIKWCEEGREQGGSAESTAVAIQMAEWQLLFDWCAAV